MSDSTERCSRCRYYQRDDGVCRRFPPQVFIAATSPMQMKTPKGAVNVMETQFVRFSFPMMDPGGWCGEWKWSTDPEVN